MSGQLKAELDNIYTVFHCPYYLYLDPVQYVHRFVGKQNIEIGGLLCSSLSYGRVEQIRNSIEKVLRITGTEIYDFSTAVPLREKMRLLSGIKHRFNTGTDIALLLECCAVATGHYGSLEALFVKGLKKSENTIKEALDKFVLSMRAVAAAILKNRPSGMYFFLPRPAAGSTCKRLNMFLRWMIREDDGIDCGAWKSISPSKLVMPVDTHVAALAKRLALTKRKSVDWRMAEEITATLKTVYPNDPVRCDFSLCRAGMVDFRNLWKAA